MYADNPLARIGYLQSAAFRSSRLVVDTGIHAKGWSREQAIQSMMEATGDDGSSTVTEIERYCVSRVRPAATWSASRRSCACAPMRSRRLAIASISAGFHDTLLTNGSTPLTVTEQLVQQWVAGGPSRLEANALSRTFFVAEAVPSRIRAARAMVPGSGPLSRKGIPHAHHTPRRARRTTATFALAALGCARANAAGGDAELTAILDRSPRSSCTNRRNTRPRSRSAKRRRADATSIVSSDVSREGQQRALRSRKPVSPICARSIASVCRRRIA